MITICFTLSQLSKTQLKHFFPDNDIGKEIKLFSLRNKEHHQNKLGRIRDNPYSMGSTVHLHSHTLRVIIINVVSFPINADDSFHFVY